MFERLTTLSYPNVFLTLQYRMIPLLSNLISALWYRGQLQYVVDPQARLNTHIGAQILRQFCGVPHPIMMVNLGLEG